jgi:hypothetical protein
MSQQQVTIEQAYEEACQVLGETIVQQRLMAKAASTQIEALTAERNAALVKNETD